MDQFLHIKKFSNVFQNKQIIGVICKRNFSHQVSTMSCSNRVNFIKTPVQHVSVFRDRNLLSLYTSSTALKPCRFESTNQKPQEDKKPNEDQKDKTLTQRLKQAVTEYGSTVIVFHITISLASLGFFYMMISSGLDVNKLLHPLGISDETTAKIAGSAGTFAVAYGVHKLFAPVRIGITLTATPFIVRYLRRIGLIKHK